jgi:uncharacterized membrane protein YqjE
MLRSLLRITGIEPALESVEHRIEDRAQNLILQGKAVAIQSLIAAGLATGAAILALMALAVALIAFFLWLEPQVGSIAALGAVAGILLVLGIFFAAGAVIVGRKKPQAVAAETAKPIGTTDITTAPTEEKIPVASSEPLGFTESPPTQPVTTDDVEALFAIGEQFARLPHTGIDSVDNVLRALAPKAEDAARETVVHAANLVRYGDRSTMLATLGMALAIGWAMTRLRPRHEAKAAVNS